MTSQALPAWNVVRIRCPVSAACERDLGGLLVADLTDRDDLGILAKEGFQARFQGQPGGRIHLRLRDPGDDRLDGVLHGGQAAFARTTRRELAEAGVDRGRLAGSGRPAQDDGPRSLVEDVREPVADLAGQAQVVEPEEPPGRREHADDGLLAEDGRERAEPHLDLAQRARIRPSCGTSFRYVKSSARTLSRATTLGATLTGSNPTGCKTPSTRHRTSSPSPPGWKWTSLAPTFRASASTRSTTSVA